MATDLWKSLCGALLFTSLQAHANNCAGDAETEVRQTFEALEATRDERSIRDVYASQFSQKFRTSIPFDKFYQQLIQLQDRLGIGAVHGRGFSERSISLPQSQGMSAVEPPPVGMTSNQTQQVGPLQIEIVTSSPYGKIRQRAVVTCADNRWQVEGIWYVPYY